jgi:hypothetical protein
MANATEEQMKVTFTITVPYASYRFIRQLPFLKILSFPCLPFQNLRAFFIPPTPLKNAKGDVGVTGDGVIDPYDIF